MATLITPNLNGSSHEALCEQRRKVAEAILALREALGQAFPHGRDYQLKPENYEKDVAIWRVFGAALLAFEDHITEDVHALFGLR